VNFKLDAAAIDNRRDDDIPLLQAFDRPRQNVARTQSPRFFSGKQQIARAHAHTKARAYFRPNQRRLQFHRIFFRLGDSKTARHRSAIFVQPHHCGVEDIFESGQLCNGFEPWSTHHLMRLPLRNDSARIKHDDLVTQSKYFFAIVCDQENRYAVMLVPLSQIVYER